MSLQCYTGEWFIWCAFSVIIIIVWVVGLPLVLLVLMSIAKKQGTLHFPSAGSSDGSGVADAVDLLNIHFRIRRAYGSMYDGYKVRYWYFESVIVLRKLIFCGIIALYTGGRSFQVFYAVIFAVAWLYIASATKPFIDATHNRMLEIDAIQVVSTLCIGLVLQLQADGSIYTSSNAAAILQPDDRLSAALIVLNLGVFIMAIAGQPLLRHYIVRFVKAPQHFYQGTQSEKEWKKVWRKRPLQEDYDKAVAVMGGLGEAQVWCDNSLDPPVILSSMPVALTLTKPANAGAAGSKDGGEVTTYHVDHLGKVILDLTRSFTREGVVVWSSRQTMQVFEGQAMELYPAPSFRRATHWLNTNTMKLLHRPPVILIDEMPSWRERYDTITGCIWRNTDGCSLRRDDPKKHDDISKLLSLRFVEDKARNFKLDPSKTFDVLKGEWVFKPMWDDGSTVMLDNPQTRAAAAALEKVRAKKMKENAAKRKAKRRAVQKIEDDRRLNALAQLKPERRVAPDGGIFTKADIVAHYGHDVEWNAATPELRVAPGDPNSLTLVEFEKRYGGIDEWNHAESETRIAPSGNQQITRLECEAQLGRTGVEVWDNTEPNKRVATDGNAYTRAEFIEFFTLQEYDEAAEKQIDVMQF